MNTIQITIQRKLNDGWPVVVEESIAGVFLPVRKEGMLQLDQTELLRQVTPKDYGTVLGKALFRDDVRDGFVQAISRSQDCLRVLHFVEAPDLRTLRWERLCAPLDGTWDFLALDQRVPFCLYLPSLTDRLFPPIGRSDLRALVLVASPQGLKEYNLSHFDVWEAVSSVRTALGEITSDVLGEVEGAVGPPTLDALCKRLTAEPYTLLHVVCHGIFQARSDETVLLWAGADKPLDPVETTRLLERLRRLRSTHGLPCFAFLATCESASSKAEGALGGLGQRLVRELGMPAVIAMTERVTLKTAQALGEVFYRRLREHGEVDRALGEATAGLAERYDITVPALFSRLGGRPLFSDTLDRPLTPKEIDDGLGQVEKLFKERAPVLCSEFKKQVVILRGTLGANTAALSTAAQDEREKALDEVNKLCGEVLDLSFKALALGQDPPAYDGRCPFRGLYPFKLEDCGFFFGREKLVEALQQKLAKHNFLAVLGPSGCGKSSLVMAGLIPALQAKSPRWQIVYLTPGSEPLAQLEANLSKRVGISEPPSVIVVVDQFEELFTLCTDEAKRRSFLDRLLAIAGTQMATDAQSPAIPHWTVVLTMRADFWGECAPYPELKAAMLAHQELLAPLDAVELRRAIELQAAKVGLRFEADLSNTILEDVRGEPGATPLLQHALLELWRRRHGRWLRLEEYRAIGGVQQAIARTADDCYTQFSSSEQARIRDIFMRLTRLDEEAVQGEAPRDTRRRVGLQELVPAGSDPEATKALVKRLADARLVVTSRNEAAAREEVEVAHEALIRYWPRLHGWLDEHRTNLRLFQGIHEAAMEWEQNRRDESYLVHRERRLRSAQELFKHPAVALNDVERRYINACVALFERNQRTFIQAEIRVLRGVELGEYHVELNVPGWRIFPPGRLRLDSNDLMQFMDSQAYGRALGQALFANDAIGWAYRETVAAVRSHGGKLRVRLRLDPPELHSIFWERLYHPLEGGWYPLTVTSTMPFSRYVPAQRWEQLRPVAERPLRLLAVIASPSNLGDYGLSPLPPEERQALHAILDRLPDVVVTYLETATEHPPTVERLQQALTEGYHFVHFLCHGGVVASRGTVLFLEREDGGVRAVPEDQLVSCFEDQKKPPMLCFLAGSETAALGLELLTRGNVPAVICMTGHVSIKMVARFTGQFYPRLLNHGMVDLAVNEMRGLLQDEPSWAIALFSQLPDNQLIDFATVGVNLEAAALREAVMELRIFADTGGEYPVEGSVPGWREFPRGVLQLNPDDLGPLMLEPQAYGRALGQALFANDAIGWAYRETVAAVRSHGGKLRVRLRLDPPELHSIFWERLYHPLEGGWYPLTVTSTMPFSRYVPAQRWEQLRPVAERPLRLLAVIASPSNLGDYGLSPLPPEERQALHAILDRLPDVVVTYLETATEHPPTVERLQQALTEGYHFVHFLCHSRKIRESDMPVLFLEGEDGDVDGVTAEKLTQFYISTMIASPWLCFLSAPSIIDIGWESGLPEFGLALVERGGTQTVVTMMHPIRRWTAQRFSEEFYHCLLTRGTVDIAVSEARAVVYDTGDWGAPVLFSQSPDNQLINF